MKIAVIGAGAIGGLVAGYLKLKGEDVSLAGHTDSVKAIAENGLQISGIRGNFNLKVNASEKLSFKPDLIILATKTQDIDTALKDNLKFLEGATILTTQNGVQADDLVTKYISKENIISSIVMFGATYLEPAKIVHNFEGSWIIGKIFGSIDEKVIEINKILNEVFPTIISEDIKAMKYLKIFVNANNCIPAILGLSMQEAFLDAEISRISIAIWKEGLEIVNGSGISLLSLPDFPVERITKLTSLPTQEAAKIFSGIMTNLSKEPLYGSILQSIKRGRDSEIDYINGEFVNLAKSHNLKAPLNEKLVEMVHRVEKTKRFFSKEELLRAAENLFN
jgi:2-dehydropantoate 2-reductase